MSNMLNSVTSFLPKNPARLSQQPESITARIDSSPPVLPEIDGLSRPDSPLSSLVARSLMDPDDDADNGAVPKPEPEPAPSVHSPTQSEILPLSAASSSTESHHSNHLLVPIPTRSVDKAQASFTYPEDNGDPSVLGELPPEIATADISIAHDGSFVETSSGAAAMELKKRYDQHYGVRKGVKSPYAITALINQHGKQMYRLGLRDMTATDPSAASEEDNPTPVSAPSDRQAKRRSQLSFHMFKNTAAAPSTSSRPQTAMTHAHPPRKLRKTRSIPDNIRQSTEVTGRMHSQSVTAADMPSFTPLSISPQRQHVQLTPSRRPRAGDMFGDAMDWALPPSRSASFSSNSLSHPSSSSSSGHSSSYDNFPSIITSPFGPGVSFEPPSRRTGGPEYLRTPRLLREMQSFESGLTARQPSPELRPERVSAVPSTFSTGSRDSVLTRPPSAIRLRPITASSPVAEREAASTPPPIKEDTQEEPEYNLLPSTSKLSRYSTDVFDVLQTYRGLPLLDRLSPDVDETTVIKLSLASDDSAAPRDDPRFVIWGDVALDKDDLSFSQESVAPLSSASAHSSSLSRRRSNKGGKAKLPDVPNLQLSPNPISGGSQRLLIAATIERWIAQLTSELNYDELLDFFLTYRTYVSSVDLCHLLICRFHWSLQKPKSALDERKRRVVRVRTFVAMRYWLLTFFSVDFIPNRELRLLIAGWLNILAHDPILKRHNDGLSTVRKLKKVVKDCKRAHTHVQLPPASKSSPPKSSGVKEERLFGQKFAEATRKPTEEDSDLDLDFEADGTSSDPPASAHMSSLHLGSSLSPGPNSIALSSLNIFQRPDPQPGDLDYTGPFLQTSATLPIHSTGPLSRVLVKTIGRLGRWKRVLNNRSSQRLPPGACTDVSAFDLELSASRDLLTVRGGVEQYLKLIEQPSVAPAPSSAPVPIHTPSTASTSSLPIASPPGSPPRSTDAPSLAAPSEPSLDESSQYAESVSTRSTSDQLTDDDISIAESEAQKESDFDSPSGSEARPESILSVADSESSMGPQSDQVSLSRTSSTDSFGRPLSGAAAFQSPWQFDRQFDIASIDDLDFSDSDEGAPKLPPGLRKPTRKLPLRRDFEFVRRPESVSSMGIHSHDSVVSTGSTTSSVASVGLGGGPIQQWQMNALIDSLTEDGEDGDADAALKRLEGQINPQRQQEKASKVDGWVKTIQARLAAGDYGYEEPRFPMDDEAEDAEEEDVISPISNGAASAKSFPIDNEPPSDSSPIEEVERSALNSTPIAASDHSMSSRSSEAKPAPEDAVPLEILQSRMPSGMTSPPRIVEDAVPLEILQSRMPSGMTSPPRPIASSKLVTPDAPPRIYRSFILTQRSELLAQHFAIIDRELFLGVKFEELVLEDWTSTEEVNILDWAQYLKDRARWKAESRWPEKTSALAAVRARFNLMANFTISEIVLTLPSERYLVVSKFIRIAWKSYCLQSFNTLVAIITALGSEWVLTAMRRHWNRLGDWETRRLNDLKQWSTSTECFQFIRASVDAIVDAKPLDAGSHGPASVVSAGGAGEAGATAGRGKTSGTVETKPTACIPFIGIYLSQLHRHNQLPDLIDPSAPNEVVGIDHLTANFDTPAHPDVFSTLKPLPAGMNLEPLINVHKQRMIAGVIKKLVHTQHVASRMQFPVDKKLFQRCLRLRGLDDETLHRALLIYPD